MRHLVSIADLSKKEIISLIKYSVKLKKGKVKPLLKNKTLVMIFEKPSLRTRISFEIGMTQLGGHAIFLAPSDIGLGKRESVADTAKVVSSMADIIMARTFSHETVTELAKYSSVPVINGLSDKEHPCQILADLMTIYETFGKLPGLKIAFIGDAKNNVANSMKLAADILGIKFKSAAPKGYGRPDSFLDPEKAVRGADVVVTDTWVSMGDENEKDVRQRLFKPFQVDSKLMSLADKNAIFLHCLPTYRGYEVMSDVIDGPQSRVWQEAENRLHAQKALILFLLATL